MIEENFEMKQMQFRGKSIIVNQKLQEIQNTKSELSTKDLNFTKSRITNDFKYITKSIEESFEESFDNFDKNNSELRDLQEDILSFVGFVEIKRSKNLTLKIADGAIQNKLDKTNNILTDFLEKTNKNVNNHLAQLNLWLKNTYSVRNINIPNISISKLSTSLIRETLAVSNIFPEKVYEKQISFKNLGHLLMELRTPLFMLMPFMMVFAVFGALINSEDLGTIDESQLFYNNRPCVAITSLPVSRDNAFRKFINELNALRDPKKGVFDKEINNELVTEPQLAIKKMEVVQSFNNKIKVEETLDYLFDNKNQILYLFLRENADRSFVIEQLFDPNNKLLSIPSSNRRGFGIGGFIRALSSLHEYKYVILISLVSLIFWFVVSRKKSMDIELKTSKEREQSKLNSDLRQHIEKNIKQSLLKYNSKIIAELNTLETSITKDMERNILNIIEASKKETIKKEKVMQKRLSGLKTEKSTLTSWSSDFNKLVKKTTQLETKFKRLKQY
ncbi:hypothetical protein [Aquimarina agarilytica]|uniref:hypothetical protein n=1 Tax=Aquimarina agarilytica TaxID=1087449 RepID=UPI00028880BC|nr:hypothetical protein [Aquimarina agarilytica]